MDNGWRNALFSMLDGPITPDQQDQLRSLQASWVILNDRLGRFYIDIIGPTAQLQAIKQKLIDLGRDPIVIGVFDYDGNLFGTPNKAEYLNVAPGVVTYTYDALGNLLSTASSRPTSFIDVHSWAGWATKVIP